MILLDDLYPHRFEKGTPLQDKLLIPVLIKDRHGCYFSTNLSGRGSIDFVKADRTNIEITIKQSASDLKNMQEYLLRLYCWFLLGPVIILEWLRRKKKLFACLEINRLEESLRKLLWSHGSTRQLIIRMSVSKLEVKHNRFFS